MPSAPLSEASFRDLLDERGVLRAGALTPPAREASFAVFSQRPDLRLDAVDLDRQASRFFSARLGLSVDKRYVEAPLVDAAHVVVAGADATLSGTRLCFGRAATRADVDAAAEAERRQGSYGLTALAQRCPTLWLIVPTSDDDRVALSIAAVFASRFLGPISPPGGAEIFGVRTARLRLEAPPSSYR